MVKRVLLTLLVLLLAAAAFLAVGVWWLLNSEEGTPWLLARISSHTEWKISAGQIEGRLRDHLRLQGVRILWPEGEARFEDVELHWRPGRLLSGHLQVESLSVRGGRVSWMSPPGEEAGKEEPLSTIWPRLSGWPLRLSASIGAVLVENIELQPPDGAAKQLELLRGGLGWRNGVLDLSGMAIAVAGYRMEGSASAGFGRPRLDLDLHLELPEERGGVEKVSLKGKLVPIEGAMAGPLALRAEGEAGPVLQLAAEIAAGGETLWLRQFALTRPGRPGKIDGSGKIRLSGGGSPWELQMRAASIDLEAETGVRTDLSGRIEAKGEGAEYRGSFALSNRGGGWRLGRVSASFAGDAGGVDFRQIEGAWLRGTLAGTLHLVWRDGFALSGALQGRGLDPSVITPDWPGRINVDLAGDFARPASGPQTARLNGRLLASTLRGEPLTGAVEAELAGKDLRLDVFELHGEGFDFSGQGRLAERIDFKIDVARLSALLPGGRGSFAAQGWMRWRAGEPAGAINGHGRQLAFAGWHIGTLKLNAFLPGGTQTIRIAGEGSGIAFRTWQLTGIRLNVSGSLPSHSVDLQAWWSQGELRVAAAGGWRERSWTGALNRLEGQDADAGSWQLTEPAGVAVAADRIRLSPLQLAGSGSERLMLVGDLAWPRLRGGGEVQWKDLDLSRANPWLPEITLSGMSSGKAGVRLHPAQPPEFSGKLLASGRLRHREQEVAVREVAAEFAWKAKGLQGQIQAAIGEEGRIDARVSTPEPFQAALPRQGRAGVRWQTLDLALLAPWVAPLRLDGRSGGEADLRWFPDGRLNLSGRADATVLLTKEEIALAVEKAETVFRWDSAGLLATLAIELEEGGRLDGRLRSAQPGRMAVPERGELEADWSDIDLVRLRRWLPPGLELTGRLHGNATGEWLPGGRFAVAGTAGIESGRLAWQTQEGELSADLRTAKIEWRWRDQALTGEMELALSEYGKARGDFRLPLPAGFPFAMNPEGTLKIELDASARERGLLAVFLPGLVRESHGQLELRLRVGGTWRNPDSSGTLRLARAGAFFPAAGIEVKEVALSATLSGDTVQISSLSARSGPGLLTGSGRVQLRGWKPVSYQAQLQGERFEAVRLPELRMLVSPQLQVEGTDKRLRVRGTVRLPELSVLEREQQAVVRESPDVVVTGLPAPSSQPFPLALDIRVKVILGEHVLIKAAGVDARLEGDIDLQASAPESIAARGEIRVAQGSYSTYGVKLKIARGRLLYSGGPVDQPTLDILALRTIDEVKAGVQVGGTPRAPVVRLYSEPAMPDTEILSYVVLGRPVGAGDSGQAGLLTAAAGALLSRGESAALQDRLKQRLGVDVLEVESGGGDVATSMITIGKYLSPKLYLSFGQSLFSNTSEARLRYNISRRWEVESKVGEESGIDLYYKIEFR